MSEVRSRLTRASSSACRVFGRCDFIFEFRESNEEARKEPQGAPLFFRSLPLSLPLPLSLLPLAPPQFSPHRTRSDGPWPVASPAATASEEQRKQKRFSFLFLLLLLLYSILLQRCRSPRAAPRAPAPPQAGRGACAGVGARRERGTWRLRPSMLLCAVMARLPRGSAGGRGRRRVLDKNRKRRKMSFFSSFSGRKSFLRQLSWCSLVQKKPIQSFDASRHRHCLSLFLRYFRDKKTLFQKRQSESRREESRAPKTFLVVRFDSKRKKPLVRLSFPWNSRLDSFPTPTPNVARLHRRRPSPPGFALLRHQQRHRRGPGRLRAGPVRARRHSGRGVCGHVARDEQLGESFFLPPLPPASSALHFFLLRSSSFCILYLRSLFSTPPLLLECAPHFRRARARRLGDP